MSKVRDLLIRYKTAKRSKNKYDADVALDEFLDMGLNEVVCFEDCEAYRELEKEAMKRERRRKRKK